MRISFVIPVKNEEETLRELTSRIFEALTNETRVVSHEVIFIDDGSDDASWRVIQELSKEYGGVVKGLRLRKNFGKAAALAAGFAKSNGEVVFTMDADLQDDPQEIQRFLDEILGGGVDMVSGWKRKRHDPWSKTAPSKLFNWITSRLTGVKLHDFNCGFKCYRRAVVDKLKIYGEMHRYIPVLADDLGFRVSEIEVLHHPREHGVSKYGWERYARGLVDLLTVLATTRWLSKPGHLFGGVGILFGILGGGILSYLFALWLLGEGPIGGRPLFVFGVMISIFSFQMISLGVIAEFFIKVSFDRDVDVLVSEAV